MEQSDLDLLTSAPPTHLQALVKLRRIAPAARGQTQTPPSKITIEEIGQELFKPEAIHEALQGLSHVERLIMRELVACGGRANSRDLAFYFTSSGLLNSEKNTEPALPRDGADKLQSLAQSSGFFIYPAPHPHGVFEQALHRLLALGLLFWGKQTSFTGRDYASGAYDGVLIVPQAVQALLETADTEKQHMSAIGGKVDMASSLTMSEHVRAFQRTLYLYWSLVGSAREGLPLLSTGLLSRPALRLVIEQLTNKGQAEQARSENEVPRLLFIRLLLLQLALLHINNGSLYSLPADDFFSLPPPERARRCYRLWLESPFWNELANVPEVILRPSPAATDPAHYEAVRARQSVVERVLQEEPSTWRNFPAVIARAKLYIPHLLFPRQYGPRAERYSLGSNPYGWDFRLRRGWLTHREGWHLVEGGFIRAILAGPLHWMGLVELDNPGEPTAFRVDPAHWLVTSETAPSIQEQQGRLIIQPNFELVALAPLSEALLIKLDRFAERLSLEHIAQYRLTKASVTRAIQKGLDAETIQRILLEAAGEDVELPQNVRYSLAEWERQARRIEIWQQVTLLEVDSPALLDSLFADEQTRSCFGRRLSPVLAEVAPARLSAVQDVLWQQDFLPSLTGAPAHDSLLDSGQFVEREPQWILSVDGTLRPRYAVTDLFLNADLARFTEPAETTGWRTITPFSIRRALDAGLALTTILGFLQRYCQDGVPGSFMIRLKLWANGYADRQTIQVEQAPLLYLSDQVLQDLWADEELAPLLDAEVAQQGRLVRVPPQNLDRVVELLKERGFAVE